MTEMADQSPRLTHTHRFTKLTGSQVTRIPLIDMLNQRRGIPKMCCYPCALSGVASTGNGLASQKNTLRLQ